MSLWPGRVGRRRRELVFVLGHFERWFRPCEAERAGGNKWATCVSYVARYWAIAVTVWLTAGVVVAFCLWWKRGRGTSVGPVTPRDIWRAVGASWAHRAAIDAPPPARRNPDRSSWGKSGVREPPPLVGGGRYLLRRRPCMPSRGHTLELAGTRGAVAARVSRSCVRST